MPPNRKGHNDLIDGIAELNVAAFVKESTFPPLTRDKQTSPTSAETSQVELKPPADAQSYWDWPADATIKRIEEEERTRQLFSCDRMEANLEKETKRLQQKSEIIHAEHKNADEVEAYWSMSPPETDAIAMELTAAQHIQDNLKKRPTAPGDNSSLEHADYLKDPSHPGHSYWDWPSAVDTKQRIIQSILEKERVRELFQVDHIEKHLMEEARKNMSESSNLVAANDAYWVH